MTESVSSPSTVASAASTAAGDPSAGGKSTGGQYRVLARKYRPRTFAELIGQQAMVRTLTNAIASDRLAHAFILTGVRGIGKTTTARLIARALNCIGADGDGGPTIDPCGVCEHCRAIAEDRHVDVMEMDAASRTGVDDIREIIEGVRYRPTSARYKVYIIDEVHMLSKNAFNALLKTLEEPPEHVKFLFATTEIRKVPVTVLSRCQRFDLKRVDKATLVEHFRSVAEQEQAAINEGALGLIARAADGSVRDGLSLLDQAIAHGAGEVSEEQVRAMLGLADRESTFDLFDAVMRGDIPTALTTLEEQYTAGADPLVVLQDLLEVTHWLTRVKVTPGVAEGAGVAQAERERGQDLASRLSMAELTRAWQMILKGLSEVHQARAPLQAAEMVLVRLAYATTLPTPLEVVERVSKPAPHAPQVASSAPSQSASSPEASSGRAAPTAAAPGMSARGSAGGGGASTAVAHDWQPEDQVYTAAPEDMPPEDMPPQSLEQDTGAEPASPGSFTDVVALAEVHRESLLAVSLRNDVHLVHFEPGRLEFRPGEQAPPDLALALSRFLNRVTTRRWVVSVSSQSGNQTLAQQHHDAQSRRRHQAEQHPLVKQVLNTFPEAKLVDARPLNPTSGAPSAAPENGDS